jgi:hypothetical protein
MFFWVHEFIDHQDRELQRKRRYVVKIYIATSSLVHFEDKTFYSAFKDALAHYNAGALIG